MTKRIEAELIEMNRLKRLELEFLFFRAGMDETMLQKFRKALTNENLIHEDIDLNLQYVWVNTDLNYNLVTHFLDYDVWNTMGNTNKKHGYGLH